MSRQNTSTLKFFLINRNLVLFLMGLKFSERSRMNPVQNISISKWQYKELLSLVYNRFVQMSSKLRIEISKVIYLELFLA